MKYCCVAIPREYDKTKKITIFKHNIASGRRKVMQQQQKKKKKNRKSKGAD